jgi:hypothetical protein
MDKAEIKPRYRADEKSKPMQGFRLDLETENE